MKIILLDNVVSLGKANDIMNVKPGYARNFLFPQGKAIIANKKNLKNLVSYQKKFAYIKKKIYMRAQDQANRIHKIGKIVIFAKSVDNTGKLFGSIKENDICKSMRKFGINVAKKTICFTDGVIRFLGEYNVMFKLHKEVFAKLVVKVEKK
ncbi:MAG: 50S ribosomal subunit protein L9 [Candidatus Westeberhardia cardiocondylae]|nr:50S ribosomal subunit protein L9 [Candidatus Westeberhardia cardiocondylae]